MCLPVMCDDVKNVNAHVIICPPVLEHQCLDGCTRDGASRYAAAGRLALFPGGLVLRIA